MELDVFLIGGQSNAAGSGNGAMSPKVPAGKALQFHNGVITDANDPVGNAGAGQGATIGGSPWPAFCRTYYRITRRPVMVVPAAVSGSAQCYKADTGYGNWDASGTLVDAALTKLSDAMTAATAAGWEPIYNGLLWSQGESDGWAINNNKMNISDYKNAFGAMIIRFLTAYPDSNIYIFRTGKQADSNGNPCDSVGWATVRQGQLDMESYYHNNISTAIYNLRMVYLAAAQYPEYKLLQSDGVHYTQQGYNMMGHEGAIAVVNDGIVGNVIRKVDPYPYTKISLIYTD